MARDQARTTTLLQPAFGWLRLPLFYLLDLAVVLVFLFFYYLGRGFPSDRPDLATSNALDIIRLQQALGIFHEGAWQRAALNHPDLIEFANFVYTAMHMPLIVVLGLLFFLVNSRKHRVLRNAILLSAFVAVPIYYFYPLTPPRLLAEHGHAGFGFVDTLPTTDRIKPGALANWYAAMPSYHYGWNFLATIGVFWSWKHWAPRAAAVAFSGVMWWAIVVTGNHYFLDMVAGAAIMVPCLWLALQFERWADRNPERVARFTVRAGPVRLPF
ncbi:MAG TPA: phosphatase PAP2 family protein [Tepidiformaceae bacterium]|nr:phosphatase PAP2 family protein [Tepidiformaceae bacterium]